MFRSFDWWFVGAAFLFIAGAYTDAWAHNHIGADLDPFFTPWHGMMYAGFFLLAGLLIGQYMVNVRKSHDLDHAVPKGYGLSVVGALVFFASGFGDMLWHLSFGIEIAAMEVLLSPTHIGMIVGASILVGGTWRRLLHKTSLTQKDISSFPALLSFTLFMAPITYFTHWVSPFGYPLAEKSEHIVYPYMYIGGWLDKDFVGAALGMAGIIVFTVILMGFLLYSMRKFIFPFGSYTFLLGVLVLGISFNRDEYLYIVPAMFAGLTIDILIQILRRQLSHHKLLFIRLLSACIPIAVIGSYLLTVAVTEGTWWIVHVTGGALVVSGLIGWMMSFLVFRSEEDAKEVFLPSGDLSGERIFFTACTLIVVGTISFSITHSSLHEILEHNGRAVHTPPQQLLELRAPEKPASSGGLFHLHLPGTEKHHH